MFFLEHFNEELVCCQLDALCVVSKHTTFTQIYRLLYGSIIKNVKSIQSFLVSNPKDLPAVYHFLPESLCHFVTIVCSHNQIDSYSMLILIIILWFVCYLLVVHQFQQILLL